MQPRWLNKYAVAQQQARRGSGRGAGAGAAGGLGPGPGGVRGKYLSTAMKIGGDLRRQYQPWVDHVMTAIGGAPGDGAGPGAIVVAGGGKRARKTIPSRPLSPAARAAQKHGPLGRGQAKKMGLKVKKPRRAADVVASLGERKRGSEKGAAAGAGVGGGRGSQHKRSKQRGAGAVEGAASARRGKDAAEGEGEEAARDGDEDENEEEEDEDEEEEEGLLADYCPFDAAVFFGDLNYRLEVVW